MKTIYRYYKVIYLVSLLLVIPPTVSIIRSGRYGLCIPIVLLIVMATTAVVTIAKRRKNG
ncbi:MAG: hypothetical protein LUE10_08445 [Alistipes sp.]|nr:hypothetical protein [Alistipes sp.]